VNTFSKSMTKKGESLKILSFLLKRVFGKETIGIYIVN